MSVGVYNNLLSNFQPQRAVRYANKSSELRSIVNKIRKQTQSSPVYLVDFTDAKQSFVLGVKEASMKMNETIKLLADDSEDSLFAQKKARSSDIEQVGAEIVEEKEGRLPSGFSLKVKQLANCQVNQGKEYYETGTGVDGGSYQFQVTVDNVDYDFQYNVRRGANHREIINGLSSFITKAKIGLKAEPYSHNQDKIGMRIESVATGTTDGDFSFSLQDKPVKGIGKGLVSYYGLDNTVIKPKNARFELNGVPKETLANEFTLGGAVRISLRKESEEPARIEYCPDSEKIMVGVQEFISNYNEIVDHVLEYEKKTQTETRLLKEFRGLTGIYSSDLESCGITFDEEGHMKADSALASQAIEEGDMKKLFQMDSAMMNRLYTKNDAVKLNPMEYVDKKIVTYPNFQKPARGYSYITSLYCGLLFNSYC